MRMVRLLFYALLALIALFVLAGLFLPKSAHVERSVVTTADPEVVFDLVNDFRRFNEWSPWFDLDPSARYAYDGPESGVGARMSWTSDKREVGSGTQEIVAVEPGRSVTTRLDFDGQQATSTLTLAPADGGTRIVWAFDTSFEDNYVGRYFGLLFDRMIGADYEKGLVRLKSLAESTAPQGG